MNAKEAGTLLRAFGDGTRLRILNALAARRRTVAKLAAVLACPKARLSRHLQYLRARGLVDWERAGNTVAYCLTVPASRLARQVLATVLASMDDVDEAVRDRAKLTAGKGRREAQRTPK